MNNIKKIFLPLILVGVLAGGQTVTMPPLGASPGTGAPPTLPDSHAQGKLSRSNG